MASMNELFAWWPLIVAVPVAIVLGLAIGAMFSDKPEATWPRPGEPCCGERSIGR